MMHSDLLHNKSWFNNDLLCYNWTEIKNTFGNAHTHNVLSPTALTEEEKIKFLMTLNFIYNYVMFWTKKVSQGISELTVLLLVTRAWVLPS